MKRLFILVILVCYAFSGINQDLKGNRLNFLVHEYGSELMDTVIRQYFIDIYDPSKYRKSKFASKLSYIDLVKVEGDIWKPFVDSNYFEYYEWFKHGDTILNSLGNKKFQFIVNKSDSMETSSSLLKVTSKYLGDSLIFVQRKAFGCYHIVQYIKYLSKGFDQKYAAKRTDIFYDKVNFIPVKEETVFYDLNNNKVKTRISIAKSIDSTYKERETQLLSILFPESFLIWIDLKMRDGYIKESFTQLQQDYINNSEREIASKDLAVLIDAYCDIKGWKFEISKKNSVKVYIIQNILPTNFGFDH